MIIDQEIFSQSSKTDKLEWEVAWKELTHTCPIELNINLSLNEHSYGMLEQIGRCLYITAREEGKLVGWFLGIVTENPLSKVYKIMACQTLYVSKDYRKSGISKKLIKEAETLSHKDFECQLLCFSFNTGDSTIPHIESLGFKSTDIILSKKLGEK